jgi:hypothetical protein
MEDRRAGGAEVGSRAGLAEAGWMDGGGGFMASREAQ